MAAGSSVKILQKAYEMFNGNYEKKNHCCRHTIALANLNVKIFETSEIEILSSLNADISVAINAFERSHS